MTAKQSLSGNIALVTGGSRGLGRDTALTLADSGCDVIFTYRSAKDAADEVVGLIQAKERKAVALSLDVTKIDTYEAFFGSVKGALREHWQRDTFDILVNNAGFGAHTPIGQTEEETFDNLMNVHFKGVYFLTQHAAGMLADGGRIVNISTGLTRFTFPGYAAYASMKGAIEVFTHYLAKELGGRGITANVVAPGAIDNDFNKVAFDAHPQVKDVISSNTALGRVGVSEDIGGVVAFLCSPAARWVTGQRIEASGGMFI